MGQNRSFKKAIWETKSVFHMFDSGICNSVREATVEMFSVTNRSNEKIFNPYESGGSDVKSLFADLILSQKGFQQKEIPTDS
jgi:hypothetical protein